MCVVPCARLRVAEALIKHKNKPLPIPSPHTLRYPYHLGSIGGGSEGGGSDLCEKEFFRRRAVTHMCGKWGRREQLLV